MLCTTKGENGVLKDILSLLNEAALQGMKQSYFMSLYSVFISDRISDISV